MTDLSGQYLGRYYLAERLGEGGMAVVYKAYDTRLERDVAIKIIRSDAFPTASLTEVLKRFEREAKSLAKLSHPNIVKVYDYGDHEGEPFLVMEYLPGGTLKQTLGKPLPWRIAVRLLLPVARGVAYAHQRGILHRDIKPANILITDGGEPMLSDFGIAKLFEGDQTTALTGSGIAIGTPEYMAPEQWTGITSPQSDLYSLGVVLYEMVAGRKPYVADTPAAILIKQATEPLPSPRKFAVDLPEALEHSLIKALAKEAADRYQTISAFIAALEDLNAEISAAKLTESKSLEKTFKVPSQERFTSASTEVSHQADEGYESEPVEEAQAVSGQSVRPATGRTFQAFDETGSKPVEIVSSPPAKPKAPSRRISYKGIGLLVGGIFVLLALWLSVPLIGRWFSPSPSATAVATLALSTQPILLSPAVQASETPASTSTPAEIGSPTTIALPTEITDAKGAQMVLVSAGEFIMGIDPDDFLIECRKYDAYCPESKDRVFNGPAHRVYLDSYYIDKYEVTNILYKACVDAGICEAPNSSSYTRASYYGNPIYNNYPVIRILWEPAKTYCQWRGAQLPTEAQWEKAARGTDGRLYPWGNDFNPTYANIGADAADTTKVGSYLKDVSPYGAYDMYGNVYEWVADWWSENYYTQSPLANPLGPNSGRIHIVHGTSWYGGSGFTTISGRVGIAPFNTFEYGFRCVRAVNSSTLQPDNTQTPAPAADNLPTGITDDKGVSMALVPEGEFTMGSDNSAGNERPAHRVFLDAYYIDVYEVTNKLYKACVDVGICERPAQIGSNSRDTYYGNPKFNEYPVIAVDWNMAKTYCEWRGAGLPTEAQWAKASQGAVANVDDSVNSNGCFMVDSSGCVEDTYPVASNADGNSDYGIFNMEGNVWEWVADWYDDKYYSRSPEQNPQGPDTGKYKVVRGRGWYLELVGGIQIQPYARLYSEPVNSYLYYGFRCAKAATP